LRFLFLFTNRTRPSNCRANEFNKYFLFERYVSFVQELLTVPGVLASLTSIAEEESKVLFVRGFLRLKPGMPADGFSVYSGHGQNEKTRNAFFLLR